MKVGLTTSLRLFPGGQWAIAISMVVQDDDSNVVRHSTLVLAILVHDHIPVQAAISQIPTPTEHQVLDLHLSIYTK
jgi:hypothetical protein